MNKKYTGKEPNKILYQKTIDTIENNIKSQIPNLRFGLIRNMKYYIVLDVTKVVDYAINNLENQKIKDEIKTNIKAKIKDLRFATIENTHYYSAFEITKVIDYAINDLVRKIYF